MRTREELRLLNKLVLKHNREWKLREQQSNKKLKLSKLKEKSNSKNIERNKKESDLKEKLRLNP